MRSISERESRRRGRGLFGQAHRIGRIELTGLQSAEERAGHPRGVPAEELQWCHLAREVQGRKRRRGSNLKAERRFADAWRGMHDVKARGESATELAIEGLLTCN